VGGGKEGLMAHLKLNGIARQMRPLWSTDCGLGYDNIHVERLSVSPKGANSGREISESSSSFPARNRNNIML